MSAQTNTAAPVLVEQLQQERERMYSWQTGHAAAAIGSTAIGVLVESAYKVAEVVGEIHPNLEKGAIALGVSAVVNTLGWGVNIYQRGRLKRQIDTSAGHKAV
jgi:hypothetical protein